TKDKFKIPNYELSRYMWKDIQNFISKHDLDDSKDFYQWFKDFNISKKAEKKRINPHWYLSRIYYKFPKTVRPVLAKFESIVKFLIAKVRI
ncbi:MAG: hypothetical protein ACFFBD_23190, partial [Candidatus Hodarchaeota archaeon]